MNLLVFRINFNQRSLLLFSLFCLFTLLFPDFIALSFSQYLNLFIFRLLVLPHIFLWFDNLIDRVFHQIEPGDFRLELPQTLFNIFGKISDCKSYIVFNNPDNLKYFFRMAEISFPQKVYHPDIFFNLFLTYLSRWELWGSFLKNSFWKGTWYGMQLVQDSHLEVWSLLRNQSSDLFPIMTNPSDGFFEYI